MRSDISARPAFRFQPVEVLRVLRTVTQFASRSVVAVGAVAAAIETSVLATAARVPSTARRALPHLSSVASVVFAKQLVFARHAVHVASDAGTADDTRYVRTAQMEQAAAPGDEFVFGGHASQLTAPLPGCC
eukprot:2164287-Prymnesium_polylepis.1